MAKLCIAATVWLILEPIKVALSQKRKSLTYIIFHTYGVIVRRFSM